MSNSRDIGPVLGLIPAKLGSVRLPRKNIRMLAGKPLLEWTVDAARKSGVIDRIVVSTEDEEVAAVARKSGAEIPFMRPPELARDPAGVVQVGLHALEAMRREGAEFRTLVILLPTCPLRSATDIVDAMELFRRRDGRFLMSVSQYPHQPFAAMGLGEDDLLSPFFQEYIGKRSQEVPVAWRANGAVHVLDVKSFEAAESYYAEPLLGFAMPRDRSVDIDTEEDWREVERILERKAMIDGGERDSSLES